MIQVRLAMSLIGTDDLATRPGNPSSGNALRIHQERQLIEPGFVYRHLLGALPDRVSGSRTGGRRRDNRDVEFVPGDVE